MVAAVEFWAAHPPRRREEPCAVIPDPLEGTPRRQTERPTGVVVQGPMTSRPALLAVFALSLAWITIAMVYYIPSEILIASKSSFDEKGFLR